MLPNTDEKELARLFECPVCLMLPLRPTFCINGHQVCLPCRKKLAYCSMCRGKFTDNRCIALEFVIDKLLFACNYKADGCKEKIKGEDFQDHINQCPYRSIVCNETKGIVCEGRNIPYRKYMEHMKIRHRIPKLRVEGNCCKLQQMSLNFNDSNLPLVYFKYDGKTFFVHTAVRQNKIHWWVSSDEVGKSNKNYIMGISIHNLDEQINWNMDVLPLRQQFENLDNNFASLHANSIQPYLHDTMKSFGILLKIWDMKISIQPPNFSHE